MEFNVVVHPSSRDREITFYAKFNHFPTTLTMKVAEPERETILVLDCIILGFSPNRSRSVSRAE